MAIDESLCKRVQYTPSSERITLSMEPTPDTEVCSTCLGPLGDVLQAASFERCAGRRTRRGQPTLPGYGDEGTKDADVVAHRGRSDPAAPIWYNLLVMEQSVTSAGSPHRQRHVRPFAPALLAVLAALALIGCPASTPINDLPVFSDVVHNQSFQAGQTIRPVVLPPAIGGSGTLTYSLRPEVPGRRSISSHAP